MEANKYKIEVLLLGSTEYQDEKFLTGGKIYLNYKEALSVKNKLKSMSSNKYKVTKLNK